MLEFTAYHSSNIAILPLVSPMFVLARIGWVQLRREALLRGWIGLLLELADLRITRASLPGAVDLLDRLLAVDPANEAAVQRLIRLLAHLGRGTEARAMYEHFTSTLSSEYHLVPLPETRALYASCVLES